MKQHFFIFLLLSFFAYSCGVSKQTTTSLTKVTADQARTILEDWIHPIHITGEGEQTRIFSFETGRDSSLVRVVEVCRKNGAWVKHPPITFTAFSESVIPLTNSSGIDTVEVRYEQDKEILIFPIERDNGRDYQKSVFCFYPGDLTAYFLSFNGSRRSDGKIYGNTDIRQQDAGTHIKEWADSILKTENAFVFLSEQEIKSDQAIRWWIDKNGLAGSKGVKIIFGSVPDDCTLVKEFQRQKKESNASFSVALFDTVDYTVIVARAKASGKYLLCWVEPKCKDDRTDPYLNSVYFSSGNRLKLFYYKGKRTFEYVLSLSTGELRR